MSSFFDASTRKAVELAPGVAGKTFWGEQMLCAVVELAANAVVPMHSHPHEQAGMVIEGEIVFTIGSETKTLRAGDCYLIPGDVEHGVTVGDMPAKALDIFSPVREAYQFPG